MVENKTPTVDEIKKATKRKAGRPPGSVNKNSEYKRKKKEREKAIKLAWERGVLDWKLDDNQKQLRDIYYNHGEWTTLQWLCARQLGKCISGDTPIMTPNGIKRMEDIEKGDYVIGYNSKGELEPTQVIEKIDSGEKEVFELYNRCDYYGSSTDDHVWLTRDRNGNKKQKHLKQFLSDDKVVRKFYQTPMGDINVPDSYVLGVLLGDGCSRQGVKQIHLSSENDIIPKKCGEILDCYYYKNSGKNYTWALSHYDKCKEKYEGSQHTKRLMVSHYDEWCKDRYAHEKILDYDVVKTWNRESILRLIAGILDSDGSVHIPKAYNTLTIQICMQAKPVLDVLQKLIYDMFQYQAKIVVDNRSKYKNGPVYGLKINHNLFSKRFLKELSPYIQIDRKAWKPEYEFLKNNNICKDYVGLKKKNKQVKHTYDLTINNDTNLFLTGDGLVTHNSYLVCTIINEEANRNPGITMAYIAPKLNQAKRIVNAKMREILADCPEHLKPKFNSQDNKWVWENGSELYLAGTDNGNAESIRGMTLRKVFVDEYCFLNDFEYVMNSIIFPTMMSVPDPLMVLISSPPKTADHESNVWLDEAENDGRLVVRTVYDCPRHSSEKIERIIREQYHNDPRSIDFRREMMCERIADASRLVLNEAAEPEVLKRVIQEMERPDYYTRIESFDWGFADKNAGLLAYIDYDKQELVIEDEMWLDKRKYNTKEIVEEIQKAERNVWQMSDCRMINRWGDNNNPQMLYDMSVLYNFHINKTDKMGLQATVNHVRDLLKTGQIKINPRCTNLIEQIQSATWVNAERKKFSKKTTKDEQHHYDLVAALVYLVRNAHIQLRVDPYPEDYQTKGMKSENYIRRNAPHMLTENGEAIKSLFTIKKKRKW